MIRMLLGLINLLINGESHRSWKYNTKVSGITVQTTEADIQNVFIPDSMQEGFMSKPLAARQIFISSLVKAGMKINLFISSRPYNAAPPSSSI